MISIHALREEGDSAWCATAMTSSKFQSTPSARRATRNNPDVRQCSNYFNPRPPRGERHEPDELEEGSGEFQSTPSARRATLAIGKHPAHAQISIHALREEGDHCVTIIKPQGCNFNPRPPRGGRRPALFIVSTHLYQFQSTPSARRATGAVPTGCLCAKISIHALREESDSCGTGPAASKTISIHALREEGDRAGAPTPQPASDFNPRPPRGERRVITSVMG